ncbi:MAG: Stp1/IreP family PP2C-type Ser/Thr phosphatase [Myxococcales bacterium]|nr:Stp1/IreP family PP2C-type Ser/Thr phosphatase [Myxococcales bacterium]
MTAAKDIFTTQALASTHIGRVKRQNEDAFLVDKRLKLFVVADGMGGHAAGEVASETAVEVLQREVQQAEPLIERFIETGDGRELVLGMLEDAVRNAGKAIYTKAQNEPEKRGMGTTVSALLLTPCRGFIAHVGDSRIYLVRGQDVFQLTEDHSLINELIKRGRLKPEDAHKAPYKNAVTRAVGVHADVQVDTLDFEVGDGDHFLLCSDGLTNHLRDDREIVEVMGKTSFLSQPEHFINLANERGGKDNITTLVVQVATPKSAGDTQIKVQALRQMPLFQHLSYVELTEVLNVSELKLYEPGDLVFGEGSPGDSFFVVIEGRVGIRKGEVELARLGPGGHFGEMAIMDKGPRSATVMALMPSRLIRVGRKPLFRLMRKDKEIAVKLLWCFVQVLNQRLRMTNADLQQARTEQLELEELLGLEEITE